MAPYIPDPVTDTVTAIEKVASKSPVIDVSVIAQTVLASVIAGILLKMLWDYWISGRMKKADFFMATEKCENFRQTCCVHDVKKAVNARELEREHSLAELNEKINSLRRDMKDSKEETKGLREEVTGIRTSIDTLTGMFKVFARTNGTKKGDIVDDY